MSRLNVLRRFGGTVLEDLGMKAKVLTTHYVSIRAAIQHLETLAGVSKAMHAMMFGHRGADLSGLVLMNSRRQSAANKPPMLKCRYVLLD